MYPLKRACSDVFTWMPDLNHIPDAAMTAAVLAPGDQHIAQHRASWRVKDNYTAMATQLRELGATVEELADYLQGHATPAGNCSTGQSLTVLRIIDAGHVLFPCRARRRSCSHQ